MPEIVEKHQLAGLDAQDRGFNRVVELDRTEGTYRAVLRYETVQIAVDGCTTEAEALRELVRRLHAHGYAQLRSQMSFRGTVYCGSREPWIEYPDPDRPDGAPGGLVARLLGWFRRRKEN